MIINRYSNNRYKIKFDLKFLHELLLIDGDSGTGKSLFYKLIKSNTLNDDSTLCINKDMAHINIASILKDTFNKLVVIDNADIILGPMERHIIASGNNNNQYIILGRDTAGLVEFPDQYAIMTIRNNIATLDYPLLSN